MFDFSGHHVLLAGLGVAIVLAYWVPRFFSGREPAAAALLIGLGWALFAFVPHMPGAVDPLTAAFVCERASEMCVVVGLFGVGLRIDRLWTLEPWRATIRLLVFAMPLTILALALLGWWMAGLSFAAALLLGAVLAPTDPVLAGEVQVGRPAEGGEHPVRFALTTEAGHNDGLAFPFVHLALLIAGGAGLAWSDLGHWAAVDLLYRVAMGIAGGVLVGRALSLLLFAWPRRNPLADTESGVVAFAGVLAAYGLTELAEGYGFVAAFVAGLTVRRTESGHAFHARLHDFSESLERALTALLLVGLGAALPATLGSLDWQGALIALLLILVVRPLVGWLSLAGTLSGPRQRLVVAAYGIRGIGSLYYLSYATTHRDWHEGPQLWAIVSFAILLSTILHGFTAGIAVDRVSAPGGNGNPIQPLQSERNRNEAVMSQRKESREAREEPASRHGSRRDPDLRDAPFVGENPQRGRSPGAEDNPKRAGGDESNRIKDPEDWVTGDEPMTGAQKSYLKTLSEEAHDPGAYDDGLDKAEASKRIDALKEKTGR